MRNLAAIMLGLLFTGLGLFGAAAVTPAVFPAAFTADGHTTSAAALTMMLAITGVFTMFGGWVTARLAADHLLGHALTMAVLGLAVAVFFGAVRWAAAPAWYYLASYVMLPAAAGIGCAAWERSLRRRSIALERRAAAT